MNIIKLEVMFECSLEWDCRGQISLPTGMGGKLKTSLSCTVGQGNFKILSEKHILLNLMTEMKEVSYSAAIRQI